MGFAIAILGANAAAYLITAFVVADAWWISGVFSKTPEQRIAIVFIVLVISAFAAAGYAAASENTR